MSVNTARDKVPDRLEEDVRLQDGGTDA